MLIMFLRIAYIHFFSLQNCCVIHVSKRYSLHSRSCYEETEGVFAKILEIKGRCYYICIVQYL